MKNGLLCILTLSTLAGSLLFGQDITGTWQGTLGGPPGGLRTILKITKTEGGWSAQMFDIDQMPDAIPVSSITLEGSGLKYSIDLLHGSYTGKLSADGSSISGTWIQGKSWPLNYARATKETAWPIDWSPPVKFISVEKDVKLEVLDWGGTGKPLVLLAGRETPRTAMIVLRPSSPLHFTYTASRDVDMANPARPFRRTTTTLRLGWETTCSPCSLPSTSIAPSWRDTR